MPVLLGLVIIVGLAAMVGGSTPVAKRPRRGTPNRSGDGAIVESPSELAAQDPLAALQRYGTSADAASLAESGVNLSALGYDGGGDATS